MTMGQRIRQARLSHEPKITQQRLAKVAGVTRAAVSQWENGDTKSLEGGNLMRAAQFLGVRPNWLLTGTGSMKPTSTDDSNVEPVEIRRVPLISWVQAGNWSEVIGTTAPENAEDWQPCAEKCGPRTFALRVCGISMEPDFHEGDIIYVDPDQEAENKKLVIAYLEDEKETTFKQLIIEGNRRFLKALNPIWPDPMIPIGCTVRIVGKVIGRYGSF